MPRRAREPLLLAIDTGSERPGVAIGLGASVEATREAEAARASGQLLQLIDAVLADAGVTMAKLEGVVALCGPGSFTGLRVGLATALALRQALGVPSVGVTAFEALASLASGTEGEISAVVPGFRGDWFVQHFRGGSPPEPLGGPRRLPPEALSSERLACVVGPAALGLAERLALPRSTCVIEPGCLATAALRHAASLSDLTRGGPLEPLYLAPPAARPGGLPGTTP